MLPIGQTINHDDQIELQNQETDHMHVPMDVLDALTINEDDDNNDGEVFSSIENILRVCYLLKLLIRICIN